MSERRKLSKSACEKFMQCPASYDYHYNQKIRPIKTGSPLVFGNGIDSGLNAILLASNDPMVVYRNAFAEVEIGHMLPSLTDYDGELLTTEKKAKLLVHAGQYGYNGDDVDSLAITLLQRIKDNETLSENQYKAVDILARASLEAKAELMFTAYKRDILPKITKVHNVQKASGPGFLDATVDFAGYGKTIVDHKTSGRRYPDNAVEYSAQLAMYAAEEQVTQVAYIVFIKQMKKNREKVCSMCGNNGTGKRHKTCEAMVQHPIFPTNKLERCDGDWTETVAPECEIQVVMGEITPQAMAVAAELQHEVQRAVDAKIFPCNVGQCNSQFGKPCVYRDLKWKNDMTGLEVKSYKPKEPK